MHVYGNRRDYSAIDIYVGGKHRCTTTWSRSLGEARLRFLSAHPEEVAETVSVGYADDSSKGGGRRRLRMWI
jgi:hypothetical protein